MSDLRERLSGLSWRQLEVGSTPMVTTKIILGRSSSGLGPLPYKQVIVSSSLTWPTKNLPINQVVKQR